ncbi:prepilin peptidase [Roseiterribacter gracilis]|uniref:prepilin peptidase n=1 Tax=Roseiterribacter gracilis TaxID=2812848 RepID=UPI003B42C0E9
MTALLGLVQGSLFATIVLRLPQARPIGMARSVCDACGVRLVWFELVPLLSWGWLRGRCRRCGTTIALVHPLLEAGSMLVWIAALYLAPGDVPERFAWGFLGASTLALLWSDFADQLLPDLIVGSIAVVGLTRAATLQTLNEAVGASLLAGSLLLLVRWAFIRLRKREALGFGDVKLFAALGLWMQPQQIGPALLIAALATLTVALAARVQPQREIPFGPGLLLGAWIVFTIA